MTSIHAVVKHVFNMRFGILVDTCSQSPFRLAAYLIPRNNTQAAAIMLYTQVCLLQQEKRRCVDSMIHLVF